MKIENDLPVNGKVEKSAPQKNASARTKSEANESPSENEAAEAQPATGVDTVKLKTQSAAGQPELSTGQARDMLANVAKAISEGTDSLSIHHSIDRKRAGALLAE